MPSVSTIQPAHQLSLSAVQRTNDDDVAFLLNIQPDWKQVSVSRTAPRLINADHPQKHWAVSSLLPSHQLHSLPCRQRWSRTHSFP